MPSELPAIWARAVELVEAIAPDYRPAIALRRPTGNVPLVQMRAAGTLKLEASRMFEVRIARTLGIGKYYSPLELIKEMAVTIRYELPDQRGLWDELSMMAAVDEDQVIAALTRPSMSETWPGLSLSTPQHRPGAGLLPSEYVVGAWFNTVRFSFAYEVDC